MRLQSPLRYPGGKARLGPFFGELIRANGFADGGYAEPYAGGAGVALYLLLGEFVDTVYINDIDEGVHAFWLAVLDRPDEFCELVERVPLTTKEWRRQKAIFDSGLKSADTLRLGFATFYLNRTNRSGILNGGIIGGKEQTGKWKLDARFNRRDLVERIRNISRYRRRIRVSGEDALSFLNRLGPKLSDKALLYLDPPYYVRGRHLYSNFYGGEHHRKIAGFVGALQSPWVVSYDDHPEIRGLYAGFRRSHYTLGYSARERRSGSEVMFFSHGLVVPEAPSGCRYPFPSPPKSGQRGPPARSSRKAIPHGSALRGPAGRPPTGPAGPPSAASFPRRG